MWAGGSHSENLRTLGRKAWGKNVVRIEDKGSAEPRAKKGGNEFLYCFSFCF